MLEKALVKKPCSVLLKQQQNWSFYLLLLSQGESIKKGFISIKGSFL